MKLLHLVLAALAFAFCPLNSLAADSLLGQPAPDWQLTNWLNSAPLALKELRGQVVLVRWWTAPQCEFCRVTAPALNEFHTDRAAKGLRVIGIYHHKLRTPLDPQQVAERAAEFGFKFPVAIDPGWRTLRRWWLDGHERHLSPRPSRRHPPHTPRWPVCEGRRGPRRAEGKDCGVAGGEVKRVCSGAR